MKKFRHLVMLALICFSAAAHGQTGKTESKKDSLNYNDTLIDLLYSQNELMRELADSIGKEQVFKNKEKQVFSQQMNLIAAISKEIYKVDDYFKKEIDTIYINANLSEIENEYLIASGGIINDSNASENVRNLSSSALLLKGLQIRLDKVKGEVENNILRLEVFRKTIDSLQNDTIFYKFAKDSVLFKQYFEKLIDVSTNLDPIDASLTALIKDMHECLNRINALGTKITSARQEIIGRRKFEAQNIFLRDSPDIWDPGIQESGISETFSYSYSKGSVLFIYYARNNLWRIILLFTGFLILLFFVYRTRKLFKATEVTEVSVETKLALKYPLITSAFISLIFFEFLFPHPPVVFQGTIWMLASIFLSVILWTYFTRIQRFYWFYLFIVFIIIFLSDLILKESNAERWFLLAIAASGIFAGGLAIKNSVFNVRNRIPKIVLLSISIILLAASLISNVFGRFNLSKTFLTISYFMLMSGYLLYWGMILASELLNMFAATFESRGNESFRLKLDRLKTRTPALLKILFLAGWFILLARNFYIYEYFMDGLVIFLEEERTVGDFTFSFEKILVFILILFLSALLSKIIAFFADSSDSIKLRRENKAGLSNWMLLIRIAIMAAGVIFAFAATGIPIDKMVIIIGSLGVGIGFGLQALVNNLVSGLLLAFEKPFQIGDFIDIGDKSGRIKEIGIRSSKISTSDGADIIIPNGDLLSKHVTNWTMRNTLRRSEINLSFNSADKDNRIRDMLREILDSNESILKNMPSDIMLNNFSDTTSEYRLSFWTDIDNTSEVKSEIMQNVKKKLSDAGAEKV